jgi:hypothetical protein
MSRKLLWPFYKMPPRALIGWVEMRPLKPSA